MRSWAYSKSVHRRAWLVFAALQVTAIGCGLIADWATSGWAAYLWGISFIGLMPGNIVSGLFIERALWNSGMMLQPMSLVRIPIMLLVNGVAWYCLALAFKLLKKAKEVPAVSPR